MGFFLDDLKIEKLLEGKAIVDKWPWSNENESEIESHLKSTIVEICRKCNLKNKTDYDHYHSGYASYVDAWFFRDNEEFRYGIGNNYQGLVVLFSRLSNFYVIGQGQKTWNENGSSSYMPSFDIVDDINHNSVIGISEAVRKILKEKGYTRLLRNDVAEPLDSKYDVPTILAENPLRVFDAIFYWED